MRKLVIVALATTVLLGSVNVADAQRRRTTAVKSGPETGLLGVTLYDSGASLIRRFGSPDVIEAITIGSGGGAAGGGGGGGGGGRGGAQSSGGAGASAAEPQLNNGPAAPDALTDLALGIPNDTVEARQSGPEDEERGRPRGGGPPGAPGAPPGATPGGAPGGASPGGGASASSQSVQFTRWIYKYPSVRYGFVLDKFNKVVQIEAIGLKDAKAVTRRGVRFGSMFGDVMTKYGDPDGYDIAGDQIVIRFMDKNRVAFKLARLGPNQKHKVTGIVVAAGKK
ncbi:MAG: hypothetical protein JST40_03430 [Armatimonadetes bacterium]|nr:hypothetical protein [Armatimonadota bacterium]